MRFKLGDVVTPIPGKLCSGYRFTIIKGEVKGCSSPEYKLKYFGDGIDPAHGPKENQLNRIKIAEDEIWFEDEIDYAGKYITIGFPKIEFTSYQEHEPTPDEPEPINHVCIHHLGNKNLFDGGFVRTGITVEPNGGVNLNATPYEPYIPSRDDAADAIYQYYNNLCEKEKNEMKILDLYKDRKLDALNEEYADKRMEIKEKDEIQSVIAEMQKQVMTILENDGQEIHHDLGTFNLYTKETKKKLEQLESKYYEAKKEINREIEEIESLFEMTKDYEDRIKILKNYNVLNKNGKVNA